MEDCENQLLTECLIDEEKHRRLKLEYENVKEGEFNNLLDSLALVPNDIAMIISKFFIIPEWYNKKWVIERIKKLANIFQLDLERRMSRFAIETELLKATQRIPDRHEQNPGFDCFLYLIRT